MSAVDIDVYRGKSTVSVMRLSRGAAVSSFEISYNGQELKELIKRVKLLPGETKVVIEFIGKYYEPIANISITRVYLFP